MGRFQDKIAWVTGASSGIGAEICKQFNAEGGTVVLSARNKSKLEDVKAQLVKPENAFILPLDLEDQSTFEDAVNTVIKNYQQIDFLFNNGGVSQRGEAGDSSIDVDRKIMEVNYFGAVGLTKAVLPHMRKAGGGQIIAVSSIAGKFGFYWRSAYSAAKHALQGFFESLLLEEAKNNIAVTIAYPGKINTDISKSAINAQGEQHGEMDRNQSTGMPVEVCVKKLLKAVHKKKKSVLIGNKEIYAVYIKRFCPPLFWKIIRKQSPT